MSMVETINRLAIGAALFVIRGYQLAISPFLGSRCRFHPSCSEYASEAIERHGILKGAWLSIKRILKCHPYSEGGIDPVQK
ncbi:MAG: membrane protein insertion efficiency factor YidD [Bdellovibrionales bacterium]|nr:membrane protein insertion efficiency factor YidD [Bdellovibrionales bacterium]